MLHNIAMTVSAAELDGFLNVLVDDWKPAAYSAVKVIALYLTAALAFRFTQRRTLAQFTPFDWVAAVAVGAIVGRSATAPDTSWLTAAVALMALILTHAAINRLRFIPAIRRLIDPPIVVLVHNGEVLQRNLRRCGLTTEDLDTVLRQHGHLDPRGVQLAIFEATGLVSVFGSPAVHDAG